MKKTRISELMSGDVKSCRASDSMAEAARLMWEGDCGCAVVTDAEDRAVGMITDRGLCMAAHTRGLPLADMTVAEAMSRELHACRAEDALQTAEDLMAEKQVRRLAVVSEDGRPVGVLSLNDLARRAEREARSRAPAVTQAEVARVLAATSQPRL